jgi:hypothetical protein
MSNMLMYLEAGDLEVVRESVLDKNKFVQLVNSRGD